MDITSALTSAKHHWKLLGRSSSWTPRAKVTQRRCSVFECVQCTGQHVSVSLFLFGLQARPDSSEAPLLHCWTTVSACPTASMARRENTWVCGDTLDHLRAGRPERILTVCLALFDISVKEVDGDSPATSGRTDPAGLGSQHSSVQTVGLYCLNTKFGLGCGVQN